MFNRSSPLPETDIIFDSVWDTFVSFANMPMSCHNFSFKNRHEINEADYEMITVINRHFNSEITDDEAAVMLEGIFNGMIGK
ncbi:MAG: hypothetical protein FWE82_06245 [Defluviitaleaceae bacterium]|nr:hypothetical protein [Defluviitaleaceae bacterium]